MKKDSLFGIFLTSLGVIGHLGDLALFLLMTCILSPFIFDLLYRVVLKDTKQTPIMKIKCLIKWIKEWQRICYATRVDPRVGLKLIYYFIMIYLYHTLNFHNWRLFCVLQSSRGITFLQYHSNNMVIMVQYLFV